MEVVSPESYWWEARSDADSFPSLATDLSVDVAIIGAGITGLTLALHLKLAGKRVIVLEAGTVGAGTTGGTSAHLDVLPDQGVQKLIEQHGEEDARRITAARVAAIDQIERWSTEYGIECDFRRVPARIYTEKIDRIEQVQADCEAAHRLGLDVALRSDVGLPFTTIGGFEVAQQARLHPIKYVRGLARAIQGDAVPGGHAQVFEHTFVRPPEDGTPCVVHANGQKVLAQHVVLATHSAYLGVSQFDLRQAPYQSYVMAVRVEDTLPDMLFWDDEHPYHYTRRATSDDPDLLIVGGADHKTGQSDSCAHLQQLEDYVTSRFRVLQIERRWSAEYFEPADGLPYIGRVPGTQHLYMATGYSGTGLSYGTVAGKVIAALLLNQAGADDELFSPARLKPLTAAKDFLQENLNAAKHFVADRFTLEEIDSLDVIQRGQGRLVKLDGEACAIYRDEQNRVHVLSCICTHAGCYVHWNDLERTWDCPCHGGRYAPTGQRLYGPPGKDLARKPETGAH
jgi:glycine/D-amino acid oxidase-like deaminating enzyme/nitrite reductase/ring-hydroxylating ferredoxin subunit